MGAETRLLEGGQLGRLLASMRPRHDGRGNRANYQRLQLATLCFNEAAPRWARKLVHSSVARGRQGCFNEAAPRWARKQGGRVVLVVVVLASMRPRHDGRGNPRSALTTPLLVTLQ